MLLFLQVVILECLEDLAPFQVLRKRTACKYQFQRGSKFVSYLKYLKLCLYHVHDGDRRDLEIPGGLTLNLAIRYSLLHNLTKNELTIVSDDERGNGRQLLCGDCTSFNIESIPIVICVVGTSIRVTKVASHYIEVAVNHDDNSGVPKQREISRHCVSAATCQL